jgi:RNA recognition motif. (a.k.a. RRM, RBD, or RNP domain)
MKLAWPSYIGIFFQTRELWHDRLANVGRCRHTKHERGSLLFTSLAMADSIQPNTTLYINNLNDRINKDEIRSQLYALFTTYGKLIDVVATKTPKMRGQAFLVFTDLPSATAALRACDGMIFYNKPMVRPYRSSRVSPLMPSSTISVFHMQKANRMPLCAVRTLTSSHRTFPMLLLQSVCVRLRNPICVPSARGWMKTTTRWTLMMMTMMRRVLPHRRLLVVRPVSSLLYSITQPCSHHRV